jgi:signal transduction histidine kinase
VSNKIHSIFSFYKFSNTRIINAVFGFAFALLIFLMGFTYSRFTNFRSYGKVVEHTQIVLNSIIKAGGGHESLMANQRSFLLTKNEAYFEQFKKDTDSLRATVDEIITLTANNPEQVKNATKLKELSQSRIVQLSVEMINDTTHAKYRPDQQKLLAENQRKYNDIVLLIQEMYNVERRLLRQRLTMKEFEEKFAPALLAVTSFVALILLFMTFYLLNLELKERNRVERLLKGKIEELNLSNHHLEEFARVSSHDLKEPLRKISIFSDRLLQTYAKDLPPKAQTMLERINSSAVRMNDLIKDTLNYSSLMSKDKLKKEPVKLDSVWKTVIAEFAEEIKDQDIMIISGNLPILTGFGHQMHQLLQNLLSNAIKFADEGRKSVIEIQYKVGGTIDNVDSPKAHVIIFSDNGIGFDAEKYASKIFSVFGKLDLEKEGTGIGLAICKQVTENHDGEISVTSKEGVGTTFTIVLPASQSA